MRLALVAFLAACAAGSAFSAEPTLAERFRNPPREALPWCYWKWSNGHATTESVTRDLEAMKAAGFGGLLVTDSIGYWDDENHVLVPAREIGVMSPEWRRLMLLAIRECKRLGLVFTMNSASSGGKLCGPWPVGADAPKRLMCRVIGADETLAPVDFPYWKPVAQITLAAAPEAAQALVAKGWFEAGDGTRTQVAHTRNISTERQWVPARPADRPAAGDKRYTIVFGSTVIPGHDTDVDVLDPKAVTAHFNRFCGALMDEVGPDLVGTNKTFAGIYSVSWEGVVPSWSPTFREDFKRLAGYDVDRILPILAGFAPEHGAKVEPWEDPDRVMTAVRRARNEMFRENFYGTLAKLAHDRGIQMSSENGGPWNRAPEIFREADQLAFLSDNDMPQGEFWVNENGESTQMFAVEDWVDRFFTRGIVSSAHIHGKRLISMESFTHMRRHWSMSPSTLKKPVDKVFADGGNHVVWHTFSQSPEAFGVPGIEYFAGTHVNPNVTWHKDVGAFISYLARCEAMMQAGEPVVDIVINGGETPYFGWGRLRDEGPDGQKIPAGYNYDVASASQWRQSRVEDGWRVFPSGMRYPATLPAQPDLEGPFTFAHRRTAGEDVYFVQGETKGTAVFRMPASFLNAHAVRQFDAVTGAIRPLAARKTDDGRIAVDLDLTETGSAIVVFSSDAARIDAPEKAPDAEIAVTNPWSVSFAYHKLTHGRELPAPRTLDALVEWTASTDRNLRHFAGTARYETTVDLKAPAGAGRLSLGRLPSGTARVLVNGVACGVVWCAPWEATVPDGVLRAGTNTIVVEYTNNWINRLIGDCSLDPKDRVTTSNLQLLKGGRTKPNGKQLNVYSGYCEEDELQPSGLTGPVKLLLPRPAFHNPTDI